MRQRLRNRQENVLRDKLGEARSLPKHARLAVKRYAKKQMGKLRRRRALDLIEAQRPQPPCS